MPLPEYHRRDRRRSLPAGSTERGSVVAEEPIWSFRCAGCSGPHCLVDLSGLLHWQRLGPHLMEACRSGPLVRLSYLVSHPLSRPVPRVVESAAMVGSVQVRNRATWWQRVQRVSSRR